MNTLTVLFALMTAAQAAQTHLRTCGGLLNVTDAEVNPTTIWPGEDITLTLKVANGYAPITDGLFYFHAVDQLSVDVPQVDYLCDIIACPIRFGRSAMNLPLTVPPIRTGGHMRIEMTTRNMQQLLCIQIEIEQTTWLRSLLRMGDRLPLIAGPAEPVFGHRNEL